MFGRFVFNKGKYAAMLSLLVAAAVPFFFDGGIDCVYAAPAGKNITSVSKSVDIKSDRVDYNDKEKLVRFIGNVKFICGDTIMYASFAQYHVDTQIADFQGNIKLSQPGTEITGGRLRVYYGTQKAVFTDRVHAVSDAVKVSSKDGKALPGKASFFSDRLEYEWNSKIGNAAGNVEFTQGDKRIFSDSAVYNGRNNTAELVGNVRMEQADSDWLSGNKVCVNLEDNSVKVYGQVMGRFVINSIEETENKDEAPLPESEPSEPENLIKTSGIENIEPMSYPDL